MRKKNECEKMEGTKKIGSQELMEE